MKKERQTFFDTLKQIESMDQKEISIKALMQMLSGKGHAALLIILSLPFCLPVQIPGFSTPFGIALAFIGLRVAFKKRPWLPQWILEKKLSHSHVKKLAKKTAWLIRKIQKVLKPRLTLFIDTPFIHRINGILVACLALLMSLPLPIPFTNLLSALPILIMGLGLLEEDGLFILISYALSLLCFAAFTGLALFGEHLWNNHAA